VRKNKNTTGMKDKESPKARLDIDRTSTIGSKGKDLEEEGTKGSLSEREKGSRLKSGRA